MFRTRRRSWNVMMSEGMALVLLDARLSFDVAPNLEMTREWLQKQRWSHSAEPQPLRTRMRNAWVNG